MSEDYYKILGVSKNASKEEIKKTYRKLAHKNHPDKGGDEAEFKKLNEAYQVLSDENKRKRYDAFGGSKGHGNFSGNNEGFGFSYNEGSINLNDLFNGGVETIFEQFFGGGTRTRRRARRVETMDITLEDAFTGLTKEKILYYNGKSKTISIVIPPGIEDGSALRVDSALENEDLYIRINIVPHKR